MGENRPNLSGVEGMEEVVNKSNKLLGIINNVLSAGQKTAKTLVTAFPEYSVEYLAGFWLDIRDAVVEDYEWQCEKM